MVPNRATYHICPGTISRIAGLFVNFLQFFRKFLNYPSVGSFLGIKMTQEDECHWILLTIGVLKC